MTNYTHSEPASLAELAAILSEQSPLCDPDFDDGQEELERQFAELTFNLCLAQLAAGQRAGGLKLLGRLIVAAAQHEDLAQSFGDAIAHLDVRCAAASLGDAVLLFGDLQRMLGLLLSDPVLRENVGRRAQARIRREYLWERVAKEMNSVYSSLFQLPRRMPKKAAAKAA